MDEHPASDDTQPAAPRQPMIHERIIQPTAGMVEEMRARQAAVPPAPAPVPAPAPPAAPLQPPAANAAPPVAAASSTYPEAIHGMAAAAHQPPLPDTASSPAANTDLINTAVTIFGALVVLFAALNLITWLKIGSIPGTASSSTLGVIIAAGQLLVGVGILMKMETARAIYVAVASILLVFSLYGTYNYFKISGPVRSAAKSTVATVQRDIIQAQNNPQLSGTQKKLLIQRLQNQETTAKALSGNPLLPLAEGYTISILALVFLTRPAVKEVFS